MRCSRVAAWSAQEGLDLRPLRDAAGVSPRQRRPGRRVRRRTSMRGECLPRASSATPFRTGQPKPAPHRRRAAPNAATGPSLPRRYPGSVPAGSEVEALLRAPRRSPRAPYDAAPAARRAHVSSGATACPTTATDVIVARTSPTARSRMGRASCHGEQAEDHRAVSGMEPGCVGDRRRRPRLTKSRRRASRRPRESYAVT
jgi:hypothetical protein